MKYPSTLSAILLAVGLLRAHANAQTCEEAPNPTFEAGTPSSISGWSFSAYTGNAAFAVSTSVVHSGGRAAAISVFAPGDIEFHTAEPGSIMVLGNTNYSVSAWMKAPATQQYGVIRIIEWQATTPIRDTFLASNTGLTTNWEHIAPTFTTQANTTSVSIRLMNHYPNSAGTFYWDDVSLTRTDCATTYACQPPPTYPTVCGQPLLTAIHLQGDGTVDLNKELDDWATIYEDAHAGRTCAAANLATRLRMIPRNNVIDGRGNVGDYYHQFLAGGILTHIFAAAKDLDYHRIASAPDMPTLLADVRARFAGGQSPITLTNYGAIPSPQDQNCGRQAAFLNSCMDDHSLTASGYAWIAAFEYQRRRAYSAYATKARNEVQYALSPMTELLNAPPYGGGPCVQDLGVPPGNNCNGTLAALRGNPSRYRIIGADHGQENPNYGLGLMTSVASACAALFMSGNQCSFSGDETLVAQSLFISAQQRASLDGCNWDNTCLRFDNPSTPFPCDDHVYLFCGQSGLPSTCSVGDVSYRPSDFPLKFFYDKRGVTGVLPAGAAFQFDAGKEGRFSDPPSYGSLLWGPNRRSFYFVYAHDLFLGDTQSPVIDIWTPANGSHLSGDFTFTVNPGDNVRVSRVDYYVATDAGGPYYLTQTEYWPFDWALHSSGGQIDGHYFVKARANDDAGHYRDSAVVELWVLNQ